MRVTIAPFPYVELRKFTTMDILNLYIDFLTISRSHTASPQLVETAEINLNSLDDVLNERSLDDRFHGWEVLQEKIAESVERKDVPLTKVLDALIIRYHEKVLG